MRFVLFALLLAGCPHRDRYNTMITPRTNLAAVRAPHLSIFVYDEGGISKVWLDTGHSERVSTHRDALVLDGQTTLHVEGGKYVVMKGGGLATVLDAIEAVSKYPTVAPNGRLLAHSVNDAELVVVNAETGEARKYPVPSQGPQRSWLNFSFTPTSDAIVFDQNGYFQLDLASGAITAIDKVIFETLSKPPSAVDCSARGVRLEERTRKGKQEIVIVATASRSNPEELATLDTRVLVRATDEPQPHGDGAITMTWHHPGPLSAELLTPTCEHFVFGLEGWLYVGNVATGQYARLVKGTSALFK
jgi:hypothetical protein